MPTHGESRSPAHELTDLPVRAVGRAARLAGAVHEGGPDDVAAVLCPLNRPELLELAVALAAMVPTDYSPGDLLAWNDRRYADVEAQFQSPLVLVESAKGNRRALQPHGTHAAFNRHRKRGESPCVGCWQGERDFQRERARRRRGVA